MREALNGWTLIILLLVVTLITTRQASAKELLNCDDFKHDDLISMACNMYWEAGTQGKDGMIAVAAVTLERQQHAKYPSTVADVVWEQRVVRGRERPQFSWTNDGKRDAPTIFGRKTWNKALKLARIFTVSAEEKDRMCPHIKATERMWDMLEAQGTPVKRRELTCDAYETVMKVKHMVAQDLAPVDNSLYYHATYVDPYWSKRLIAAGWHTVQVKDHIFYQKTAAVKPTIAF